MNLRFAKLQDLDSIMKIEEESFVPGIREQSTVFAERIQTFCKGFVLFESSCGNPAGYFCSEKWNQIPLNDDFFKLGHSAAKTHCKNGSVLYITSFALLPEFRGKKNGSKMFEESLNLILSEKDNSSVQTLLLLVNEEWNGAFHIYRKNGFTEIRRVNGVFPERAGIIMKKELN